MLIRFIVSLIVICFAITATAEELRPDQIYAQSIAAVCTIIAVKNGKPISLGSGFVVTNDGLVATNRHVVGDAPELVVKCGKEPPRRAAIVRLHPTADIAIIATGITSITPLRISLESPSKIIGQPIYAIGNPEGLEGTISSGLVSGLRGVGARALVQISAPISHGSSGGPVLLNNGLVIGIATAALNEGQNLNFAVPAVLLRDMPDVRAKLEFREETAGPLNQLPKPMGPVELGEIVKSLMPPPGTGMAIGWDFGVDAPVEWLSDQLEDQPRGTVRRGRARVDILGKPMWELRKQREEIFWDITLVGWGKGIDYVEIEPQGGCFGPGNSGCSYEFEKARAVVGVKTKEMCAFHEKLLSYEVVVYRLSAASRQDADAAVSLFCGSQGCTTSLQIHFQLVSPNGCQEFAQASTDTWVEGIPWMKGSKMILQPGLR
jgi:hypothetical protein